MTRSDYEAAVPKLRMVGDFVKQVGFPVVAFACMFYMAQCSIAKVTLALQQNTTAMVELTTITKEFQRNVQAEHARMMETLMYRSGGASIMPPKIPPVAQPDPEKIVTWQSGVPVTPRSIVPPYYAVTTNSASAKGTP